MTASNQPAQASGGEVGRALIRGWLVVVIFALVGAGLAAGTVLVMPQRYIGTVTVLVEIPENANDIQTLIRTVESLVSSTVVLSDVAASPNVDLSARAIEDRLQIERTTGSAVIEVSIVDSSRAQVEAVVAEIAPALSARLDDAPTTVGRVPISVDTFGTSPYIRETSWPIATTAILGGLAGFLLGALVIVVRAASRRH